ncbi:MAG TPA: HAD-IA family hydrolase [Terriglobia bacterium]|nr:HAD-IA family hydrolase [Terriglobia bacterium]
MGLDDRKRLHIGLLIFDLDGTLIDSETDLALSVNATRERFGLSPLSTPVIASYVGQGVSILVRRSLQGEVPEEEIENAIAFFKSYYRRHMLDHTVAYPGVLEALDALSGRTLAVLTNKPVNFSRGILEGLGMLSRFSFVYGGDSFDRKKPDPVGVLRMMEDTGRNATETLMVGDSDVDIETGRSAGVWCCGVRYGIGSKSLPNAGPDFMVDNLRDLPPLIDRQPGVTSRGACDGEAGS